MVRETRIDRDEITVHGKGTGVGEAKADYPTSFSWATRSPQIVADGNGTEGGWTGLVFVETSVAQVPRVLIKVIKVLQFNYFLRRAVGHSIDAEQGRPRGGMRSLTTGDCWGTLGDLIPSLSNGIRLHNSCVKSK